MNIKFAVRTTDKLENDRKAIKIISMGLTIMISYSVVVLLAVVVSHGNGKSLPSDSPIDDDNFKVLREDLRYSTAVFQGTFRSDTQTKEESVLYGSITHSEGLFGIPLGKAEVGVYQASGKTHNNNPTNDYNPNHQDSAWDIKILSAGVEASSGLASGGLMARASVTDASVKLGQGRMNMGLEFDTGAVLSKEGVEVKVVGIGGKIGPRSVEICIFVCLGFSW